MARFAAGLTVTGILSFLLLEALKIVMVPVAAWVMGLLVIVVKVVLIAVVILAAAAVIGVGVWLYKKGQKASAEA
jgi:hypothetical protein